MLILTRKPGESLYIGDTIKVTIVEIKGHQIRVGIDAPTELRIYREEIYVQILEENRKAAEAAMGPGGVESGLESLSQAWHGGGDSGDEGDANKKRPGIATLGSSAMKRPPGGAKPFTTAGAPPSGEGPEVVFKRKRGKKPDE